MDDDLVIALRPRRVDVETAHEAGMRKRMDHEHLAYATAQGRVVYTFNTRHFCALHADLLTRGKSHAGIVVCPQQRYRVGEQIRRLVRIVNALSPEEMQNRLEFLSDWEG